jgi:hypothetical protein
VHVDADNGLEDQLAEIRRAVQAGVDAVQSETARLPDRSRHRRATRRGFAVPTFADDLTDPRSD